MPYPAIGTGINNPYLLGDVLRIFAADMTAGELGGRKWLCASAPGGQLREMGM